MTEREGPAATVRAYIAGLNSGNPDLPAACVSEAFINEHTSTLGQNVEGRDAYRKRVADFFAEFPGLHYEIEDLIVDGERVAVPYVMTGKWNAPGAVPNSAKSFRIRGMFRFRVENGKITHRVDYWDSADFQRQVGAV